MDFQQFAMILGFFWVFGWVVVGLITWHMKMKKRQHRLELIHQERMLAMEKGIPLPELPELPDENKKNGLRNLWQTQTTNPRWPLGVGAICVSLGAGISTALYLSGDSYHQQVWPFGLISVFLGFGLFLHYAFTRKS